MRVLQTPDSKTNFVGIDDHELTGLDIVTTAALFDTWKGPVIGIFHEYARLGKGRSIHTAGQKEWFNCKVNGKSKVVGGAKELKPPMDMCSHSLLIWIGLYALHPGFY